MKKNPSKIYIGIPSGNLTTASINGGLALLVSQLEKEDQYEITYDIFQGRPVYLSRNNLVKRFLETECEYILMVDDDILPPYDILEMTKHAVDIVAGLCYGYNSIMGVYPVAYKKAENGCFRGGTDLIGWNSEVENKGLTQVDLVGSGCILIHRKVFNKIDKPYFKFVFNDELTEVITGEDIDFCTRAIDAGFKVYVDTDKVCSHFKSIDLKEIMKWANQYDDRKKQIRTGLDRLKQHLLDSDNSH